MLEDQTAVHRAQWGGREPSDTVEREQRAFDRAVARERDAIGAHERAAAFHEATSDVLAPAALGETDATRSAGMTRRATNERRLAATALVRARTSRVRLAAEDVDVDEWDQPRRPVGMHTATRFRVRAERDDRCDARTVSHDASSASSPSAGGGRSAVPDGTHHDPDDQPASRGPVMTTIRRTRLSQRRAADVESRIPEGTPRRRAGDADPVRLALIDPPAERTTLDGAWWPRTVSLGDELPGLVQELHRRGIRVTRVAYNPDAWEAAPRRLAADGRTIRLGWFHGIDPQLLDLTGDLQRGRLDLLVVPPDTTPAIARQAFTAATDRSNGETPTVLLAALHQSGPPGPRPQPAADRVAVGKAAATGAGVEATEVWDSEGGHPHS